MSGVGERCGRAARAVFESGPLRTLQIPVSSLHVASSCSATTDPSPFSFLRSASYSSSLMICLPMRYRLLAIMNLISSFEKSVTRLVENSRSSLSFW